jgi:hypothetical protein
MFSLERGGAASCMRGVLDVADRANASIR